MLKTQAKTLGLSLSAYLRMLIYKNNLSQVGDSTLRGFSPEDQP